MADMETVINQAISDFDDIKSAIEEQGVDVPAGTDTKDYGNKIRSIPKGGNVDQEYNPESEKAQSGKAVAEALEIGVAIKYLESPKDNKIYLRDIESGYYVMSGYFQPYPNSKSTVVMDTMYTSVARLNAGSHIMTISPLNFKITCYEILVDDTATDGFTYTRTTMSLLDLHNKANAMVNTVDESSDNEHYPSAKAVYDFAKKVEAQYGNSLKGKASGEVIRVDDVNPIEHTVKAKVSGKNLFDMSKIESDANLTNNGNGTVTVVANAYGVSSGKKLYELCPALEVGKTYTLSGTTQSALSKYIYLTVAGFTWNYGTARVMTNEMLNSGVNIYGMHSAEADFGKECVVSNIQIEEGDTATEYEPYVDPSTVTVTRCGKNLLDLMQEHDVTGTYWGWIINPTADDVTLSLVDNDTSVELGEVYFGFTDTGFDATGGFGGWVIQKGAFSYEPRTSNLKYISVFPRTADTIEKLTKRFHIQVERGTVATDFEPPMHERYTPEADGTVNGITSVSPTMTLLTDKAGVTIEAEYNQDINAAFDKINAILETLLNGGA